MSKYSLQTRPAVWPDPIQAFKRALINSCHQTNRLMWWIYCINKSLKYNSRFVIRDKIRIREHPAHSLPSSACMKLSRSKDFLVFSQQKEAKSLGAAENLSKHFTLGQNHASRYHQHHLSGFHALCRYRMRVFSCLELLFVYFKKCVSMHRAPIVFCSDLPWHYEVCCCNEAYAKLIHFMDPPHVIKMWHSCGAHPQCIMYVRHPYWN